MRIALWDTHKLEVAKDPAGGLGVRRDWRPPADRR